MSARTDVIYTIKHLKIRKIWKHTSHSYKLANFTCAECEFIVECELTMDLHVGRFNSEDFDWRLYDAICQVVINLSAENVVKLENYRRKWTKRTNSIESCRYLQRRLDMAHLTWQKYFRWSHLLWTLGEEIWS